MKENACCKYDVLNERECASQTLVGFNEGKCASQTLTWIWNYTYEIVLAFNNWHI